MAYTRVLPLNSDPVLRAYVIGIAIGDGNLSNPNGRAVRLRVTCDLKYPRLIKKITAALRKLLPKNQVSLVKGKGNYLNVSVYSNHLENLLGWRASGGSKYHQDVCVPSWITQDPQLIIPCIRGLIETDGAIYRDRGYPMVIFSTIIPRLADQVHAMIIDLGFKPRKYKTQQNNSIQSLKYQVRLSRDVEKFLKLTSLKKN